MGHALNRENKEFIILSSQISGENTIILNTWTSDMISHSFNFPFTPPHIMETLNESQMQGMCLNPYLRDRFELCNSGCYMIENSVGNMFLFFQNSVGDIFYQCITHDTELNSRVNCKSYCILNAWENAISMQTDTIVPLAMSEKSNMQHIFECFTNKNLQLKCTEHNTDNIQLDWKQSLEKLNSYKDLLAPELLAVWELCREVPSTLPLTTAPHEKVLSWLESTETKQVLSQEDLDNVATPMNSQELISVSQEVDITQLDDSNALQELFLPKVITRRKKNSRKK